MAIPTIFADFQNADAQGRVRLNCVGTTEDLARQQVKLAEGLDILLYANDLDSDGNQTELQVHGVVTYSQQEQVWVAVIDWNALQPVPCSTLTNGSPKASARRILQPPLR